MCTGFLALFCEYQWPLTGGYLKYIKDNSPFIVPVISSMLCFWKGQQSSTNTLFQIWNLCSVQCDRSQMNQFQPSTVVLPVSFICLSNTLFVAMQSLLLVALLTTTYRADWVFHSVFACMFLFFFPPLTLFLSLWLFLFPASGFSQTGSHISKCVVHRWT